MEKKENTTQLHFSLCTQKEGNDEDDVTEAYYRAPSQMVSETTMAYLCANKNHKALTKIGGFFLPLVSGCRLSGPGPTSATLALDLVQCHCLVLAVLVRAVLLATNWSRCDSLLP
jgi:hypothetical protein